MISREWALWAEWATTWFPATGPYIRAYMTLQGWAVWAIIQEHHLRIHFIFARCKVPGTWIYFEVFYSLSTNVFGGWAMGYRWASLSYVRRVKNYVKNRDQRKRCITFALTSMGLRRSAVNPTIDQLFRSRGLNVSDISMSLAGFLCWTISHFCITLGITHHALGNWKWSVP